MNVIVTNKQKEIIDNANIDAIKDFNGLFNVDDLISKIGNYFYSRLILDATSISNFSSKEVLEKLTSAVGADRLIIFLPTDQTPPQEFINLLISLKIYNFSTKIEDIIRFVTNPNTYEDVVGISKTNNVNYYVDNSIKANDDFSQTVPTNPNAPAVGNSMFNPIISPGYSSSGNMGGMSQQNPMNNVPNYSQNIPMESYPINQGYNSQMNGYNDMMGNPMNNNMNTMNNMNNMNSMNSVNNMNNMNTMDIGSNMNNYPNFDVNNQMNYNMPVETISNIDMFNNEEHYNPMVPNQNTNVMSNPNNLVVNTYGQQSEPVQNFSNLSTSNGFYDNFSGMTKAFVLGVKNITLHAGSTTLVYLLMQAARDQLKLRVNAFEINKDDFKYFNDSDMISVTTESIANAIAGTNANIVFVDLNDYYGNFDIFDDIIYLVEPSVIRLNKLMLDNKFAFKEHDSHKLVLNMSMLNNNEVTALSKEAGVNFIMNIPPLNDRIPNDEIMKILSYFGFK